MSQPPSVGRVVLFTAEVGVTGTYPGLIVVVHPAKPDGDEGFVDLVTFGRTSVYFNHAVPFSAEPRPGCWSWPPFVPPAATPKE